MVITRAYCRTQRKRPGGSGRCRAIEPVLRRFQDWLGYLGRSESTVRVYLIAVRAWVEYGGHVGHLDGDLLAKWIRERGQTLSRATVVAQTRAVKAFYRCQQAYEAAPAGTIDRFPRMRGPRLRLARTLTWDQCQAVLKAPDVRTWQGLRDRLVLRLLIEAGVTAAECCALTIADFLDDGTLYVGGRRERYVPLTRTLRAEIRRWLPVRRAHVVGKRSALIIGRSGRGIGTKTVCHLVRKHSHAALGRAMGLLALAQTGKAGMGPRGFSPRLLRASLAARLQADGMPLGAVAQTLGHAQMQTTARYAAEDLTSMRAAVAKHPRRHPGARS